MIWVVAIAVKWLNRVFGTGVAKGWEIEIHDDGSREGRLWTRRSWKDVWHAFLQKVGVRKKDPELLIGKRSGLLGR